MIWIKRRIQRPGMIATAALGLVVATAFFSETARAAGMGLFRQIADSYLVMFIDTMSVAFICF